MKRLSIIISTMLFVAVSMMAQNQKQFIVADKNGNSPLVQSLIFQQQDANERFSWKSEGETDGYQADRDIEDLLFIARANAELGTASSEEVTEMLEEVSGKDGVSVDAFVSALQANPNVEEAYSEDGNNIVVRKKGSDGYTIYPMYEMKALFSKLPAPEDISMAMARGMKNVNQKSKRVAIFNFFEGMKEYEVQNNIVKNMINDFYKHGYTRLTYYYPDNIFEEERFTYSNLKKVLYDSQEYAAIIIFSHGAKVKDRSVFVTGERSIGDNGLFVKGKNHNYDCYSTKELYTQGDCILYLGVCDGWDVELNNRKTPVLGFDGKTIMAQADALILFHMMLYEGYSLIDAKEVLPQEPAPNKNTYVQISNILNNDPILDGDEIWKTKYINGCSVVGYACTRSLREDLNCWFYTVSGRMSDNFRNYASEDVGLHFKPIMDLKVGLTLWRKVDDGMNLFTLYAYVPSEKQEGIEIMQIKGKIVNSDGEEEILPFKLDMRPYFLIYSDYFMENSGDVVPNVEDMTYPAILGDNGQPVETITLTAGTSKTFTVDGYEGHKLNTAVVKKDVATISLSGKTLTVTGVSEGTAYMGVYDTQNKLMALVKVIVTTGGDTPGPGGDITAYTSCPDDHHPHLIDLGLPSGTKWACCNVGAGKPEDYGGYYAWGETEEKSSYDYGCYNCGDLNIDIAGTEYDVARVKWGEQWAMPTSEQCNELANYTSELVTVNGIQGCKIVGPNGGSIFLPAAWQRAFEDELRYKEYPYGFYWSSTPSEQYSWGAYSLSFQYNSVGVGADERPLGFSVRPVASTGGSTTVPDNPNPNNPDASNITFTDPKVKAICVANWDTNGDGELSKKEAAAVTDLRRAFEENKEITSFDEFQFFTGLEILDNYSFYACNNLKSISIPNSVKEIRGMVFRNCKSLTTITIPNSVTEIGEYFLGECTSLTSISIPNSVTEVGRDAFYLCENLASVSISSSLTRLPDNMFSGCKSLISIVIPNSVNSIDYGVFSGCINLTSVTIPNSVTSIGLDAFMGCERLKEVISYIEKPYALEFPIGYAYQATLYVPAGTKALYEATEGWNDFKNIVEM